MKLCTLLAAGLSLVACSSPKVEQAADLIASGGETATSIQKSPNDSRDYRYVTLNNKLRVLLVSDPKTDKAAASLVALRGSFHEPKGYLGLAHFLEHMLFIGTEKYPEVDAYQTFINAHGGSSNAYTSLDHTNYFFDVQPDYFRQAMDRFSQFFIAPLLDPAYVDREKNAVHSEYQLQYKNDGWRGYLTQKLALNPDHPGSRFTIGSLDTLGEGVYPALKKFFVENYSADQMILVAYSNETLDELQAWVTPMFEQIDNRNLGDAPPMPAAFAQNALPNTIHLQALRHKARVDFTFPVPNKLTHYQKKPVLYITNLLGHEGTNSLHKQLKDLGWIESLSAGSDELDENTTMLTLSIGLTESGETKVPQITDALFDYIARLQEQTPAKWLFDEQAAVLELAYKFQEQGSATGFVYRTAPQLAHYPPAAVLSAPYAMDTFDPELISQYLNYLTPNNLLLEVSGPKVTGDQVEPWFDVPFRMAPGPVARQDSPTKNLALPEPNPFIPENTQVLANDAAGPKQQVAAPGIRLWHDLDTQFGTPRANTLLTLGVPGGLTSVQDSVMAELYQALVNDALDDYSYPAYLAGLGYGLSSSGTGFEISLRGYSDKQAVLLTQLLKTFRTLAIDPKRFAIERAQLQNNWRSAKTEHPYRQTSSAINNLLVSSSWSPEVLADAVAKVSVDELEAWRAARLKSFAVEGLVHGNVDAADVDQIKRIVADNLPTASFDLVRPAIAQTQGATRLPLEIDHQDAAMVLYLQDPDEALTTRAKSTLAVHLMRQPYFTSLRTEQQLGYVVGVSTKTLRNRGSVTFLVQSPVADPKALQQATYTFMDAFLKSLPDMSDDEFIEYRNGLISELTEQDKNLAMRSGRYWSNLRLGYTNFDRRQQLADAIAKLGKAEMERYLSALRTRLPKQRLIAYSKGKFSAVPSEGEQIDNVARHKTALFSSGR